MKKILLLLICSLLLADQNSIYKVNLYQYAEIVSNAAHINILIDNKVPAKEIYFFVPAKIDRKDYLQTFRDLLKDCNLRLIERKNYYYVTLPYKEPKKLYSYKFKNLNISDVKFLKNVFPNIMFQFFENSNTLYYQSTYSDHAKIKKICYDLDLPYLSSDIKLTIFVTDIDKLENSGIDFSKFGFDFTGLLEVSHLGIDFKTINLFELKGVLDLLQKEKIIDIVQNPIIHLTDGKPTKFDVVKNIPVLVSNTSIDDNKVTTQNRIQYRDIGLKINLVPQIYNDSMILDLNITSETLDDITDTPITNKLYYSNSFKLKKYQALFLTGLNVSQTHISKQRIPILADLPYISPLFKSTTKQVKRQVLSILIESYE